MDRQLIINFVIRVLDDQNGISKDAFHALEKLHGDDDALDDILDHVDGIDDRYFLAEDHRVIEQYLT